MNLASPQGSTARHRKTRPRSPRLHLFGDDLSYALDVESGGIRRFGPAKAEAVQAAWDGGNPVEATNIALEGVDLPTPDFTPPKSVGLKALSLAVAQSCNLGCTYCYAQQGSFGGPQASMGAAVAKASVDRLIEAATPGETVTLAFMGGEPLMNRKVLHAATRYAAREGASRSIGVGFSLTTNATLIRPEDVALFQLYGFVVTVSIDGLKATNDKLRPFAGGRGSFDHVRRALKLLNDVKSRRFTLEARVTVTPQNLDLPEVLTGLTELGFDGIMFSPMLTSPSGKAEMQAQELDTLLDQLIQCAALFRESLSSSKPLPFANAITQLKRIHEYRRDHYPCGAGGGYMGVSADGGLFACHRFVDDDEGRLGDVYQGVNTASQSDWLTARNLGAQPECNTCWARYLCSGSCHYEVLKRGRPACDYIRGWLDYCLSLYADLATHNPTALNTLLSPR